MHQAGTKCATGCIAALFKCITTGAIDSETQSVSIDRKLEGDRFIIFLTRRSV